MRSRTTSRKSSLLPTAVFAALLFGGSVAQAVSTAYCNEMYVDGCLQTQHCTFYINGSSGEATVHYHCPV